MLGKCVFEACSYLPTDRRPILEIEPTMRDSLVVVRAQQHSAVLYSVPIPSAAACTRRPTHRLARPSSEAYVPIL